MSAPRPVGHHGYAATGDEDPDTCGRADLVPANTHEVHSHATKRHVHGGNRLGNVTMSQAAVRVHARRKLVDGLDRTDLGGYEGHRAEREASIPG